MKNYKKAYELSEQEDYKKNANAMEEKINPGKKKGFFSKLFGWTVIFVLYYLIQTLKYVISWSHLENVWISEHQTAML